MVSLLRWLRHSPWWIALSVVCLSISIAANTTVVSMVRSLLAVPSGVRNPERLVAAFETDPVTHASGPVRPELFYEWQRGNSVFEEIAADVPNDNLHLDIRWRATERRVTASIVTSNFFKMLGANAYRGRLFRSEDESAQQGCVAVIGYALWQSLSQAADEVLGSTILANGRECTVIGVLPDDYRVQRADIWFTRPLMISDTINVGLRITSYFNVLARLRDGVTISQAQANLTAIAAHIPARTVTGASPAPLITGFLNERRNRERSALLLLWGGALAILLISATNVGTLLLMRAFSRRKEVAIRYALGASRKSVVTESLYEGLTFCLLSGALGVALVPLITAALRQRVPAALSEHLQWASLSPGLIATALLISAITVLLSHLAPVWYTLRQDIAAIMRLESHSSAGVSGVRARGFLLGGEVAVTVCLMTLAALLLKSAFLILHVYSGLDPHGAFIFNVVMTGSKYKGIAAQNAFATGMIARLGSLSEGVTAGSITFFPLLDGAFSVSVGDAAADRGAPLFNADLVGVTGRYFQASGTRLLAGRDFRSSDTLNGPAVAIVDETIARHIGGFSHAIGKRIEVEGLEREVVGVARALQYRGLVRTAHPLLYVPLPQSRMAFPFITFVVRTPGEILPAMRSVQGLLAQVEPALAVREIAPMSEVLSSSLRRQEFALTLLGALGAAGYIFAMLGIYAITSYLVAQSRYETAIRLAVGASGLDIRWHLTYRVVVVLAAGVSGGVLAALFFARLLSTLTFGVSSGDMLTYAIVVMSMLVTGGLSAYLPTRGIERLPLGNLLRTV